MSTATLQPESPRAPGSSAHVVLMAVLSTTTASIPVFLLGSLAVFMSEDLRFREAELGVAASIFFASAAVFSLLGGRFAERRGYRAGMLRGIGCSVLGLAGVALVARSYWQVAAFMVLAGAGNGFTQPAANYLLARQINVQRQGMAFGIKQSAIPVSTLLAGLAVPLLAVQLGWRWPFGIAALIGVAVWFGVPRQPLLSADKRAAHAAAQLSKMPLYLMAIGGACGSAAANSMGAFLVSSSVASGVSAAAAGFLFAMGSGLGVITRLILGWLADRTTRTSQYFVSAMLVIGALGLLSLSFVRGSALIGLAAVVGFSFAWGWPGLFLFNVVRRYAHAPATASGFVQAGAFVGGVAGPSLFGLISGTYGFGSAWIAAAAAATLSAALIGLGERLARRLASPGARDDAAMLASAGSAQRTRR